MKPINENSQYKRDAMADIHKLFLALYKTGTLEQVVEKSYRHILHSLKPDLVVIYLREGDRLICKGEAPPSADFRKNAPTIKNVGECLCGLAAESGQIVVSVDIHSDHRCTLDECKNAGLVSFLAAPLLIDGSIVGVIGVGSRKPRDFMEESDYLEIIASHIAIAMKNCMLNQDVADKKDQLEQENKFLIATQKALQKEKNLLDTLVDNILLGITIWDQAGRLLFANKGFTQITGYTQEEIRDLDDWFPKAYPDAEYRRTVLEDWQNSVNELEAVRQFIITCKSGIQKAIEFRGAFLDDGRALVTLTDATDRIDAEIKVQKSEERYRRIFENSVVGFYESTPEGHFLSVNPAFAKMMGYDSPEDLVSNISDMQTQYYTLPQDRQIFIQKLQQKGEVEGFEFKVRRKDGSEIWVSNSTRAYFDAHGKATRFEGVVSDITKRKQAEVALEQSEEFLEKIVENIPNMIFIKDAKELRFVRLNKAGEELLGYPRKEMLGKNDYDFFPKEEADFFTGKDREVLRQDILHDIPEETIQTRYKGERLLHTKKIPLLDENGVSNYLLGISEDITERKQTEKALEKRMIALTRPIDDPEGITFEELFNLEDIQRLQDQFAEAARVASIITHTDGTPITKPSNFCRLCNDIIRKTDKGLANCFKSDAELGKQKSEGPAIQPCLSGGLWDAGAGISVGGRHIANWLIGQVRDETQTEMKMRAYANEIGADEDAVIEAFHEVPSMSRKQFGQVAQALFTLARQLSDSAYQNMQQARFISEKKKAEEALRQSEGKFRDIFNLLNDVIMINGLEKDDYRFLEVNAVACSKLGYTHDELLLKTPMDIDLNFLTKKVSVEDMPKPGDAPLYVETAFRRKDGVEFPVQLSAVIIEYEGRPCILGAARDITEHKQAEEAKRKLESQLRQAQKMEAVGRLAGGVAHDFNNMLSVIIGHADIILQQAELDQRIHTDLMEIKKAGDRSAKLTRQLLAFARKQTVTPKVLDLNTTLAKMTKMLKRLIGEDIDLAWIPGEDLWLVKIDPSQIDQMLVNLCVNARDAIAGVGNVTIETENAVFDEADCRDHAGYQPGEFVMFAVSDSGCGMDTQTLAHLFEPFYTTKEAGKGTGLGLATVYGIVKQNQGFLSVSSESGQGATFKIYLPRYQTKKTGLQKKGPTQPADRGHETILLVEDEPAILDMTTRILERLGYTVVAAGTPGEAIQLAQEHTAEIHLLLTDVVMPEMNGRELAKNLLSYYPSLKRLFMSGYTANVIAHHGVLDDGVYFIQKPFTVESLGTKVREAIEER